MSPRKGKVKGFHVSMARKRFVKRLFLVLAGLTSAGLLLLSLLAPRALYEDASTDSTPPSRVSPQHCMQILRHFGRVEAGDDKLGSQLPLGDRGDGVGGRDEQAWIDRRPARIRRALVALCKTYRQSNNSPTTTDQSFEKNDRLLDLAKLDFDIDDTIDGFQDQTFDLKHRRRWRPKLANITDAAGVHSKLPGRPLQGELLHVNSSNVETNDVGVEVQNHTFVNGTRRIRKITRIVRIIRKKKKRGHKQTKTYEATWYKDVLNGKLRAFLIPGPAGENGSFEGPTLTKRLWKFDHPDPERLYLYGRLFHRPWQPNASNLQQIRDELHRSGFDAWKQLVVTQLNAPPLTNLRFYFNGRVLPNGTKPTVRLFLVSEDFWHRLPLFNPVAPKSGRPYGKCAVIGNSGILLNSTCGSEIDSYDMIFRCNVAPIANFSKDAGWKSNITSFNPTIFYNRYGGLGTARGMSAFRRDMKEYHGFIWFPCFGSPALNPVCLKPFLTGGPRRAGEPDFVFGHPDHFVSLWDFWKNRNMTTTPSTGFYLTHTALQLCEETHLYGFWPYPVRLDTQFRRVPYHYFDRLLVSAKHSMNGEFSVFAQYHELGILRVHLGECAPSGDN